MSYGNWEIEKDRREEEWWNANLAEAIRNNDIEEVARLIEKGKWNIWTIRCDLTCIRSNEIASMVEEYPYST